MPSILRDKVTATPVDSDTVTFNELASNPLGAVSWGLDTLDGWDKSAPLDVVSVPVGGGVDGEIAGERFSARARYLVVGGWVLGADRVTAETLKDIIVRDAFPRNKLIRLARYEGIPKFLDVKVAGEYNVEQKGPLGFRWNVLVMAPYPQKLDLEPPSNSSGSAGVAGLSSGGRTYPRTYPLTYLASTTGNEDNAVIVYNRGTANTYPVITLTGPLGKGSWRISNETTGEDIRFDVGLGAGDTMLIDFKNQVALLNGSLVTSTITGDFWEVVPKANTIKLYGDYDPAASITVTIESAWEE